MPAEFVGYYTIYGPTGYVDGDSREAVKALTQALLEKYPNAQCSFPHRRLSFGQIYRSTVWSKIELADV